MELRDAAREDRSVPTELWFPAVNSAQRLDLDTRSRDSYQLIPGSWRWQAAVRDAVPRLGAFPLVLFSHGFSGHRRQSTFLCTHLASHGYLVAACDHVGNTLTDVLPSPPTSSADVRERVRATAEERPRDLSFVLDWLLSVGPRDIVCNLERGRVGACGHSWGGWTALATTERDGRVGVALALCPAGGSDELHGPMHADWLSFDWARVVPTLFIAGAADTVIPLPAVVELFDAVRAPKKLVVLDGTEHMHFCDAAERTHEHYRSLPRLPEMPGPVLAFAQLRAEAPVQAAICGLATAHLDAHLKGNRAARDYLAGELAADLETRGVPARVT